MTKYIPIKFLAVCLAIWLLLSLIDIVDNNASPDPMYWSYNLIVLLVNAAKARVL